MAPIEVIDGDTVRFNGVVYRLYDRGDQLNWLDLLWSAPENYVGISEHEPKLGRRHHDQGGR
jgi:hypothetical protein